MIFIFWSALDIGYCPPRCVEMAQLERKIVLLGDSATGKTALARRFVDDKFEDNYRPTAAARPWKKKISLDGKEVSLAIWDIAGHTLQLHPAFYSGAHAAILVCDLTNKSSVESLSQWHNALLNKLGIIPVIVLANKSDLNPEYDLDYIKKFGYDAVKVSAKTGDNLESPIREIIKAAIG